MARNVFCSKVVALRTAFAVTFCVATALPLNAGLVAKWDFNNYDPANPTSTNILAATVGGAGKPCYYVGKGSRTVDAAVAAGTLGAEYVGTLGQIYVVSPDYSGSETSVTNAAAGLGVHERREHAQVRVRRDGQRAGEWEERDQDREWQAAHILVGDSGRCDVRLRQWRTEARTEGRWPLS